ncbi:hypothetical protein KIW84_074913 [Lathyrus oleraceus]|uniref:Uncharacterized protein n=1 Tax=Pisum sativum TaxID=3888 RepID=A0A9D4ZXG4_PEA|nr:hypothetical protein KIW84_074913 [Pisum sativum]
MYTGTLKSKSSGLDILIPEHFSKEFRRGADGRIPVRTLDRGASSSAAAAEPTGYPGESYDTSLLVKYEHHVARHIWFGEERGPKKELKVVGHGLKLTSRVPLALPPQMES